MSFSGKLRNESIYGMEYCSVISKPCGDSNEPTMTTVSEIIHSKNAVTTIVFRFFI